MSYLKKRNFSDKTEYSVIYKNFKGVDFSESDDTVSRERFAYAENMYRDYSYGGGDVVESIPGYRKIYDAMQKTNGVHTYKNSQGEDMIVMHCNDKLYRFPLSELDDEKNIRVFPGAADAESRSFCSGDSLFVLDGEHMFILSDSYNGRADLCDKIYIPTTHVNGTEYEQRNLLTRYFYEKYNISNVDAMSHGTPTLKYEITDDEKRECTVYGISDNRSVVYIPSRVKIGDVYYSVKSVKKRAFYQNQNIRECFFANGIVSVGVAAFSGCLSLRKVVLSDTVEVVEDSCFMDCVDLFDFHAGAGFKRIGNSAFNTCISLTNITYAQGESQWQNVENTGQLGTTPIIFNHQMTHVTIGLPLHNPVSEIREVTDGENALSYATVTNNGLCTEVCVFLSDKNDISGKTVRIKGVLSTSSSDYKEKYPGFVASNYNDTGEISDVITKCRIAESFDGRIFLTGNRDYPGYCFYSSLDLTGGNNPLYFGEMNYFKDGVSNFPIIALLAAGDSLAVFKERDDGCGSIFYHTPTATETDLLPKVYPVSYVHSGFSAKGEAISFFDDPVFVSHKGISALAKKNISLERSIATRSNNVNKRLLLENLGDIKLATWQGYLVVMAGERMYLADSRSTFVGETGDVQYEWYYVTGIGGHRNDNTVYKYSAVSHPGFNVHEKADEITYETVLSVTANGETVYYTSENGTKYEVHPTEERSGGLFSPAKYLLSIEDRLIFATGDGQLFIFNNDKRGVPPPHVAKTDGFDEEEYRLLWGSDIHPYYYSFDSHRTRYAIQTKKDDCSIPHFLKSTVKNSLSVKCKAISSGKIICEVGTDNGGYKELTRFPNRDLFFEDIDFSSFSMSTDNVYTLPIHEKERGWVEKQIALYSDDFAAPFAISIIAYRFRVKGNIKRKR